MKNFIITALIFFTYLVAFYPLRQVKCVKLKQNINVGIVQSGFINAIESGSKLTRADAGL